MPMTLVVTRDVESRYRGFLTSILLEVAPGIYIAPDLSAGVRERAWAVVSGWWAQLRRGAIVMVWRDPAATGGLGLRVLGEPPKEIVDADGVLLLRRSP